MPNKPQKANLPHCPMYVEDMLGGTGHYNNCQIGTYHRLLYAQWIYGRIDEDNVYRLAQAHTDEERRAADTVIREKFIKKDGYYYNARMAEIIDGALKKHQSAVERGRDGAKKRWQKDSSANGSGNSTDDSIPEPISHNLEDNEPPPNWPPEEEQIKSSLHRYGLKYSDVKDELAEKISSEPHHRVIQYGWSRCLDFIVQDINKRHNLPAGGSGKSGESESARMFRMKTRKEAIKLRRQHLWEQYGLEHTQNRTKKKEQWDEYNTLGSELKKVEKEMAGGQ